MALIAGGCPSCSHPQDETCEVCQVCGLVTGVGVEMMLSSAPTRAPAPQAAPQRTIAPPVRAEVPPSFGTAASRNWPPLAALLLGALLGGAAVALL